jgi:hypothetical protein
MSGRKSNLKTNKNQAAGFFKEGFELAFHSKKRIKPWRKIFELWYTAASSGHIREELKSVQQSLLSAVEI